jgi:hypothetical protein
VCAWREQRCRLSGTQKVSGIADKVKDTYPNWVNFLTMEMQ